MEGLVRVSARNFGDVDGTIEEVAEFPNGVIDICKLEHIYTIASRPARAGSVAGDYLVITWIHIRSGISNTENVSFLCSL